MLGLQKITHSFNTTSCQNAAASCYKLIKENKVRSAIVVSIAITSLSFLVSDSLRSKGCEYYNAVTGNVAYYYARSFLKEAPSHEDLQKARNYFKVAADRGHIDAAFQVSLMYFNGTGGEKDEANGWVYYKRWISKQHSYSSEDYLQWYDTVNEEFRLGLKKLADGGNIEASLRYARMCYLGQGGDKNIKDARKYYEIVFKSQERKETAHANGRDYYFYGLMCQNGQGEDVDLDLAKKMFIKGMELACPHAALSYADLMYGSSKEEERSEALRLYKSLAKKKENLTEANALACFKYARYKKDKDENFELGIKETKELLEYAKKAGSLLTTFSIDTVGVDKDSVESLIQELTGYLDTISVD